MASLPGFPLNFRPVSQPFPMWYLLGLIHTKSLYQDGVLLRPLPLTLPSQHGFSVVTHRHMTLLFPPPSFLDNSSRSRLRPAPRDGGPARACAWGGLPSLPRSIFFLLLLPQPPLLLPGRDGGGDGGREGSGSARSRLGLVGVPAQAVARTLRRGPGEEAAGGAPSGGGAALPPHTWTPPRGGEGKGVSPPRAGRHWRQGGICLLGEDSVATGKCGGTTCHKRGGAPPTSDGGGLGHPRDGGPTWTRRGGASPGGSLRDGGRGEASPSSPHSPLPPTHRLGDWREGLRSPWGRQVG